MLSRSKAPIKVPILDDFSRYIIAWKLCTTMKAEDVTATLELALAASGNQTARVVQALLFLFQLRIMRRSMIDATTAANAAEQAASAGRQQARAMQASVELSTSIAASEEKRRKVLDRAYVSGGGARRMRIDFNKATGVKFPKPTNEFEVHVANHGRMTAALKRIRYGFFDPAAEIPPKPTYECIAFRDLIGPGEKKLTAVVSLPPERKTQVIFARHDYYGGVCLARN
jgi:hypothetical protein